MTQQKVFYRAVAEDRGYEYIHIQIRFYEFVSVKETPKGHWIVKRSYYGSSKRWISNTSKKRYAYPTKEEALYGLIKRTERRLDILNYQVKRSKAALSSAMELKQKNHASV